MGTPVWFVVKAERIDTQGEREACSGTVPNVRPGLGRQPKGFVPGSVTGYVQLMLSTVAPRESPDACRRSSARRCCFYTASAESRLMQSAPEAPQHYSATMGLSVILWAGHIMGDKSHGYADEEETKNGSIPGSGPRAAA